MSIRPQMASSLAFFWHLAFAVCAGAAPCDLIDVASGFYHVVALDADGTGWTWGSNSAGQVGLATLPLPAAIAPVHLATLTGVVAVGAGSSHSFAVRNDGSVWAWGSNASGQLGDGTMTSQFTPVPVVPFGFARAAAGGINHSLALTDTGAIFSWGRNNRGQLGDEYNHGFDCSCAGHRIARRPGHRRGRGVLPRPRR